MSPIMTLVMNGLTLAVYWIGAGLIAGNEIDYATVQAFTMLCTQIVMAFLMLMMMFILLPRANVCAKRIQEVIDTEVSVKDPEVEKPLVKGEEGTITFDHVSFAYPDAEADILQDISFTAKKGQTIAFIGSTGSGKSTLVNLVTRFYDVTKGSITIDGVDVRNMKQSTLRGLVGFVPQKGLLFSGTIKSNIKFGNSNASDKDVEQACKIACADEFISKMEKDTIRLSLVVEQMSQVVKDKDFVSLELLLQNLNSSSSMTLSQLWISRQINKSERTWLSLKKMLLN